MRFTSYHLTAILFWIMSVIGLIFVFTATDISANNEVLSVLLVNVPALSLLALSTLVMIAGLIIAPLAALLYFVETGKQQIYHFNTEAFPKLHGETENWEAELLANGFRYLGMYEAVNRKRENEVVKSYVYIDENQTIYGEIIKFGELRMMAFSSDYPDGFSYQTNYRNQYSIEEINEWMEIQTVKSSITAAYDYHAAQEARHNQAHGKPKKIREIADGMTSSEVKRERIRSLNKSAFQRYGLAGLVALALTIISSLLLDMDASLRLTVSTFLLGIIVFFGETIQTKIFRTKTIDQRKRRKVAEQA